MLRCEAAIYPDLSVLGAHGKRRQQVQILGHQDECCFGPTQYDEKTIGMTYDEAMRDYGTRVQAALREIGEASFRLVIDETAPSHMISHHAIKDLIIPVLKAAK